MPLISTHEKLEHGNLRQIVSVKKLVRLKALKDAAINADIHANQETVNFYCPSCSSFESHSFYSEELDNNHPIYFDCSRCRVDFVITERKVLTEKSYLKAIKESPLY